MRRAALVDSYLGCQLKAQGKSPCEGAASLVPFFVFRPDRPEPHGRPEAQAMALLEVTMSPVEGWTNEERLRARLDVLRRGIARLAPAAKAEYESLVADLERQLTRVGRERVPVVQLFKEIEAIAKCVVFELEMEHPDAPADAEWHSAAPVMRTRRRDDPAVLPREPRSLRRARRARGASPEGEREGSSRAT
jgi:hypothetical protein